MATTAKPWYIKNIGWIISVAAAIAIAIYLLKDHVKAAIIPASDSSGSSGSPTQGSGSPVTAPASLGGVTGAKLGDVVSIASGHTNVNIRSTPTANISTNMVSSANGGTQIGTFDSIVSGDGLEWVKYHPFGPVNSSTYYYVAAKYCTTSKPVASEGIVPDFTWNSFFSNPI